MMVDGHKIAKITIYDNNDNLIAELTDEAANTADGYTVQAVLDQRLSPNAIAHKDDILHYKDSPDDKYMVTKADDKFFSMCPVTVDSSTKQIKYDNYHQRTYPNNCKVGTLDDYGIALEYRGTEDGEE